MPWWWYAMTLGYVALTVWAGRRNIAMHVARLESEAIWWESRPEYEIGTRRAAENRAKVARLRKRWFL